MTEYELPDSVQAELYVITNTHPDSGKRVYVGQTQTHVLNRGKYRPFGSYRRWTAHVSEAKSNGKKQSRKLNNAIRKYGEEHFTVEVLGVCEVWQADVFEEIFIEMYDAVASGYNILAGGSQARPTANQRERISSTLKDHYSNHEVCPAQRSACETLR